MPEIAEVRISCDFINKHTKGLTFSSMKKSDASKVKTDLTISYESFSIEAVSRGKEMMLTLTNEEQESRNLIVTLGMSGNWVFAEEEAKLPKHCHLIFTSKKGVLALHDVRRFAKWKWGGWNASRSPCPLSQPIEFAEHVKKSYKAINIPLCEALLHQNHFNGVGNYLRAEIIHRLDQNPFQLVSSMSEKSIEWLTSKVSQCAYEAYILGGGQLKDWKNPDAVPAEDFLTWKKIYGSKAALHMIDATGRRFWYDPKWSKEAESYQKDLLQEKSK